MRAREKQVIFRITLDEYFELKNKADKVGLNISELLRCLISDFEPREKPPEKFYESIKQIRGLANNMNQLARRANALGFIDELEYKKNADKVNQFIIEIKEEFLLPKKIEEDSTSL